MHNAFHSIIHALALNCECIICFLIWNDVDPLQTTQVLVHLFHEWDSDIKKAKDAIKLIQKYSNSHFKTIFPGKKIITPLKLYIVNRFCYCNLTSALECSLYILHCERFQKKYRQYHWPLLVINLSEKNLP